MIQPLLVLPSNAPPLRDDDNLYQASRVLQEQSGNRQHGDYGFHTGIELKKSPSELNENVCRGSLLHHLPFFPPLPPHLSGLGLGYARLRYPEPEDEARIQADAEKLFYRICKTEGYMKYRGKQGGKEAPKEGQKWPVHVEKAFCRALVQYPPMGRRKLMCNGELRGRNELISICIQEITGVYRCRKQISSHIQVLRPWIEHDPFIARWMSKEDLSGKGARSSRSDTSGRRMSNYPVTGFPHSVHRPSGPPTLARSEFQKLRQAKREIATFQPVDFQMFVQRHYKSDEGHEEIERLHTYTNSITHPLGEDVNLAHIDELHREYPLLASIHNRQPFDCTVLDAEASLAFPTETWKNEAGAPLPGVELGIYFLCVSAHLPATPIAPTANDRGYRVIVSNTFYENGVCSKESSGSNEARIEASERGAVHCVETRIKFGSTFWARTLGRLASRLLDTSTDHSEEVGGYLRGINAVQEVHAISPYGTERLLVIHWKFRHSTGVRGRTSWRRINLPTSQQTPQHPPRLHTDLTASFDALTTAVKEACTEPVPPSLQSPFTYDSSSGSALSSATWSNSFDESSISQPFDGGATTQHADPLTHNDNAFDFTAGNIHLSYDPMPMSLDDFDSSAFNFDAAAAAANFAADPALTDYSQQWYTGFPDIFDAPAQAGSGTEGFAIAGSGMEENAQQIFHAYDGGQYDQQNYLDGQDAQAFEGAGVVQVDGSNGISEMKEGDALAALADASYMASAMQSL